MTITVNEVPITLSADFEEYVDLMMKAVVKPGDPPIATQALMIQKILADNYASNIQQHAAVRPKAIAEKFKMIEEVASKQISDAIVKSLEV